MSRFSRRAHGRAAIASLAAVATALTGSVAVANTADTQVDAAQIQIDGRDLYDNPFSGITVDIPFLNTTLVPVLTQDGGAQVLNFYNQDAIEGTPGSGDSVDPEAEPVVSVGVVNSLAMAMFAAVGQLVSGADGTTFVPVVEESDEGTTISFYDADQVDEEGNPTDGAEVVATYTVRDGADGAAGNSVTVTENEEEGTVTIQVVDFEGENVGEPVTITDGVTYVPVITTGVNDDGRSGQLIEYYASTDLDEDDEPIDGRTPISSGFVADGQDGITYVPVLEPAVLDGQSGTWVRFYAEGDVEDGVARPDADFISETFVADGTDGEAGTPGADGQDGITYVPVLTPDEREGQSGTWVRFYAEDALNEANEPLPGAEIIAETFIADGTDGTPGAPGEDGNSVTVTENEEDGSVIVQVVDSEGEPVGEPVVIEAPESGDASRGIESVKANADGDLVITYTDGTTDTVPVENNNGSSSVDADLSSNLSSGGVNPLWLAIPAVLGVIAALNFPAIQAAINSFAATWL